MSKAVVALNDRQVPSQGISCMANHHTPSPAALIVFFLHFSQGAFTAYLVHIQGVADIS